MNRKYLLVLALSVTFAIISIEAKRALPVQERGLVQAKITASSIVKEHAIHGTKTNIRFFDGPTLGYVTPWNGHGYDIAKKFKCKFDLISPTWYRLLPERKQGKFAIDVVGGHDVDSNWVKELHDTPVCKNSNHKTRVIPRVRVEEWTNVVYDTLFATNANAGYMDSIIDSLVEEAKKNNFDGYVLDAGYLNLRQETLRAGLIRFIRSFGDKLHAHKFTFVLAVPPHRGGPRGMFDHSDFMELAPSVDHFSMMTYDYSTSEGLPGPNAPLSWMAQTIMFLVQQDAQAMQWTSKLLLGFNFYGYDYVKNGAKSDAILGNKVIEILEKHRPKFVYDDAHHEHYFEYKADDSMSHVVYFPTLKSISDRIELAKQVQSGIAIWELGQGLDYFYDLL